jgi:hypothetical protein
MKFELKTQNESYSKSFSYFFGVVFIVTLIIILCDVSIKLGFISRNYQIEYNCRLLSFDKSAAKFENLSKLTNLKSKQRIWELCKAVFK